MRKPYKVQAETYLKMSEVWYCCCCFKKKEETAHMFYHEPVRNSDSPAYIPYDERKRQDTPTVTLDDIDQNAFNFVKKKLRRSLPEDTSYEYICSQAKKHLSPSSMEHYFSHLVAESASQVVLETAEELESSLTNTWEKAMLQKRSLQRFETVVNFPVKLILSDLRNALPPFASSFAKMLQLEFGALHAALVIDDVLVEWDDAGLVLPSTSEKEWVFQARLQGSYEKAAQAMKPGMKDSARRMDLKKQIEQVFEVTKEKQQAINQLIQVIVHYNQSYEYNVLVRNCQHFVIDAMKALGVEEIPQFTGVFQNYLTELKRGKSKDILEKFDNHAALEEYVNTIIKPGLTQHDLEYLLCQYFMFHVSSCKQSREAQDPEWKCKEETCRMSEIEHMLERDTGSLLFTTFSLNSH